MARMRPSARAQWTAVVLLAGSAVAVCQSTLPPMAPTMRDIEEQPANVEYVNGQVAVLAENSSLSEIIRDVARRAGMAVKGTVVDERVFGTYGPAAPAEVLTELLKGTGSNMIVLAGTSHAPELILTPKQGGPTPPKMETTDREATPLQAATLKEANVDEQPVQASTDSDKVGLTPETVAGENSESQPDAKPASSGGDPQDSQPAGAQPSAADSAAR